ncbi:4-hydroxybenzoate octaprenyltransferase [Falsirhodobacter halotolerans]|uniref:4-hydroxybenzoate octaprenyltransferase n=1 Tax=Falsirhodobacter halotolerans TaxID=1146892 RepID=UPI001FD22A8E|nr:4-hydroxybenzoate octaprenyltransferase [Falsirhodobacter halotolerans]MCJ8138807.1 4-hydroxybenzoate octaprenyltransferase [Falsirhodobacter halotolerans]
MTNSGQVADAVMGNWVDRNAPARWRPYLRLSRADRPAGTWLLLIPCWWGLAMAAGIDGLRLFDLWIAVACAAGAFLMRGAGCTWNDLTDRDFDAAVARTRSRPLPSGQVTPKQAAVWMVVQTAIAGAILLTLGGTAILLGLAALIPVAVYPFAKRFTWWPQVFLGIAFNWGILLAWAAHGTPLGWGTLALYASGLVWTLFYDTIYAHQDTEDDALIGVKSTARLFGAASPLWLVAFLILSSGLMAVAALLALTGAALAAGLLAAAAFAAHMVWQMTRLDIDDPHTCLTLFRSNRDAGLVAALFLAGAALV